MGANLTFLVQLAHFWDDVEWQEVVLCARSPSMLTHGRARRFVISLLSGLPFGKYKSAFHISAF